MSIYQRFPVRAMAVALYLAGLVQSNAACQTVIEPQSSSEGLLMTTEPGQVKRQFNRFAKGLRPAEPGRLGQPDPKLDPYMRRVLAQMYDCPETNSAVFARLHKPVYTVGELYAAMNPGERAKCDAEGTKRGAARIAERLKQQPKLMRDEHAAAIDYLKARVTLIRTQCESDLAPMKEARSRLSEASIESFIGSEDFLWDLARVARNSAFDQVPSVIEDHGLTLQVRLTAGSETTPPSLSITAIGVPDATDAGFEWRTSDFLLQDSYGHQRVRLMMTDGIVVVPEVGLDPLPLVIVPVEASWHEKADGNPSTKTRGGQWDVPDGYRYCRHDLSVWSANNVCKNYVESSAWGIRVEAEIQSGSEIDRWDGWFRFRGTLTGISTAATNCQKSRAQCESFGDRDQLVDGEGDCSSPPPAPNKLKECFREGPPGKEICHMGRDNLEGRCKVEEVRRCY